MRSFIPSYLRLAAVLAAWCFPVQGQSPEELLQKSKAVLAQLQGEIAVPGLRQPVEVLRDKWGVPHIYAQNQDDLFLAQGFVAAQDRLFQIDMWRRVAVGKTAAVLGPQAIEADRFARLVQYRGDMQAEWTSYSPDTQQIATAFTRGINAYIDQIGNRLAFEFQLAGFRPAKWRPEDLLGRMSGIIMTRNLTQEITRARLIAAVGVEKARWLAPTDPPRNFGPPPGVDYAGIDKAILAGYEQATKAFDFGAAPHGSNNWAIDGSLSRSGKPLMASDPHRALTLPALRYLVHLHAPGWNVIGGGEPALPGVALGHNEHLAWGFTIAGNDQADLYVEETNRQDPTQYRVGDAWQPMQIIREQLAVRGQEKSVEVELRFTRHGPVLHQDPARHLAYVLRWAGSEPGTAAYLGSLALDRARDQPQFVQALRAWKLPSENVVYADVEGNIGWMAAALTPVRHWDGVLPIPGDGRFEWNGFVDYATLPQSINPAEHFVATANHNILPPGYKQQIAYDWAPPYRNARIRQRLQGQKQFDLQDCAAIQHDVVSLPGQELARHAASLSLSDEKLARYARLLAAWDGSLARDSKAGPLYAVWLHELLQGLYRPHVPENLREAVIGPEKATVLLAALARPDKNFFGDDPAAARDKLLQETFAKAVERVEQLQSADANTWSWGRLHTIAFTHPLTTRGKDFAQAFNLGPLGRPGDSYTPNSTRSNEKFQQVNGATYRHLFDLADWDRGLATSAPGQSGQPGSPHYADLLPLWSEGQYFPLVYSRAKVEAATQHRLVLSPAKRTP